MQTIEIKVNDRYIDHLLTILKHLKEGMIEEIKVADEKGYKVWSADELNEIGKIGFVSESFVEDDEDYSRW